MTIWWLIRLRLALWVLKAGWKTAKWLVAAAVLVAAGHDRGRYRVRRGVAARLAARPPLPRRRLVPHRDRRVPHHRRANRCDLAGHRPVAGHRMGRRIPRRGRRAGPGRRRPHRPPGRPRRPGHRRPAMAAPDLHSGDRPVRPDRDGPGGVRRPAVAPPGACRARPRRGPGHGAPAGRPGADRDGRDRPPSPPTPPSSPATCSTPPRRSPPSTTGTNPPPPAAAPTSCGPASGAGSTAGG